MAQRKGTDVAKRGQASPDIFNSGTLRDMFIEEATRDNLKQMFGKYCTLDRLLTTYIQAAQRVPKLFECSQSSLLLAFKTCAELELDYGKEMGLASLVPFKNSGTGQMEATHITGYKGLNELVERTGLYYTPNVVAINKYMIDSGHFKLTPHLDPPFYLDLTPTLTLAEKELGPIIGYFAYTKHRKGGYIYEWMTMKEIKTVEAVSKSKTGPWKGPFRGQMEKKTVLKRMITSKMSRSPKLALAVHQDNELLGIDENLLAKALENRQSQAEQPGVNGLKDRMGIKDKDGKPTGAQAEVKIEKEKKTEETTGKKGMSYYLEQIRSYHVKKGLKDWWGHHEPLVMDSFTPDEINTIADAYNDRLALLDQKEQEKEDNKQGSLT